MKVSRLPKDPGPAGWNRLLPKPEPATPLEADTTSDWLVIGGGFAGLAAALRLSQLHEGDRITVLDATRIADGPAGRNSGFMIDLPHDLSHNDYAAVGDHTHEINTNRAGIAFAQEAVQTFGLGAEAFNPCGKINAAASTKGMKLNAEYSKHLNAIGEENELLDAAEMERITGTTYYKGGLFTPGTAIIQPASFVRGVANGLRSNRVLIHENSPVTELSRSGQTWRATTPKGSVSAPKVILAVNGHLASFGHFTNRLLHVFTYASMTRALTEAEVGRLGGDPNWGVTPAHPMGTTVRRVSGTGGDRIVIRNRFTLDPKMEVTPARIVSVGRDHDRAFAARFPMLNGVEMEHRWGGRLCLSRNSVQIIRELEPGLYSACCQNGLGTAKGTLAGMLAAELASGVESDLLQAMTRAEDPVRLPPAPATWLGANARMRLGEAQAGKDL